MNKHSSRSSHASKSPAQRTAYQKYIRSTEKQPTLDESIPFDTTLQKGEEFSEPTSKRKRAIPVPQKIREHFESHWIEWLLTVFAIISIYVYIDTKIQIAVLETNFVNQKELTHKIEVNLQESNNSQFYKNEKIEDSIHDLDKDNSSQDLIINEIKIRLGIVEDKITNATSPPTQQP